MATLTARPERTKTAGRFAVAVAVAVAVAHAALCESNRRYRFKEAGARMTAPPPSRHNQIGLHGAI